MRKGLFFFSPLAVLLVAVGVLTGGIGQAGTDNADLMALDVDITGNTATTLGTIEECAEVNPGDSLMIDLVIQNVPESKPMIGFQASTDFDEGNISVTAKDNAGLLSTAPGYTEFDAGDAIPDTVSPYLAAVGDLGAMGVSGSGFLQRITFTVAAGAPAGGYSLGLHDASHTDTTNLSRAPAVVGGARLAVGVTCESLGTPSPTPTSAKGDVDCNGSVSSVDALKILRHIVQLSVAQDEPCDDIGTGSPVQGDINCDNNVNSVDSLLVLRHVAQLPVNLPAGCAPIG